MRKKIMEGLLGWDSDAEEFWSEPLHSVRSGSDSVWGYPRLNQALEVDRPRRLGLGVLSWV
jgi:hypothetical protein